MKSSRPWKNWLAAAALLLLTFSVQAQYFSENFNDEATNATSGTAAGTIGGTWSSTPGSTGTARKVDLFGLEYFEASNTSTEAVWSSNVINVTSISGYSVISMLIGSLAVESDDYIRCYYRADGGPEVLFYELFGGNGTDALTFDTPISAIVAADVSIQLVVRIQNNTGIVYVFGFPVPINSVYALDDITITEASTIYSRKNGNWDDVTNGNSTWSLNETTRASCNCLPLTDQVAIIDNSFTVDLRDDRSVGALDIQNTGTLRYTVANSDLGIERGLLRVRSGGTINRNGLNDVQIDFNGDVGGALFQVDGTVTVDDLTLNATATNLHYISGAGSLSINDDILIGASDATLTNNMTGTLTIGDRIELQAGITGSAFVNNVSLTVPTVSFNATNCSLTNSGTLTVTGSASPVDNADDGNSIVNNSGGTLNVVAIDANLADFDVLNSGTINQSGDFVDIVTTNTDIDNLNGGVWNWTGNAFDTDMATVANFTAVANTFNYSRGGNQTIIATTYHHLGLSNSGTKNFTSALDANGNITIANTAILDGTGNINIGGNWSAVNAASFVEGTRTVNFDGATQTITNSSGTETFTVLTISGSGVKSTSTLLDVNGTLTIAGTAQLDVSNDINLSGNWTVTSTNADPFVERTFTVTLDGTGAQAVSTVRVLGETFNNLTLNPSGNKTISSLVNVAGNLNIQGTAQLTANANINLGGNWNVTSTNANPFVEGTSTVTLDGTSGQTISTVLAAGETFNNLTISGQGTKSSSNVIDVNGNLTISGTAQLDVNNALSVAGNWSVTSTNTDPFEEGTYTVTWDGTGILTTTLAGGETFNNLTVTSGTKTYNNRINVSGNLLLENAAQLTAGAAAFIGGNWTRTGTAAFNESTQTVTFNGSANQTISNAAGETFYNLTVNKSGGDLLLATSPSTDIVILANGTMTFTSGIVRTTTGESLTFNDNALVSGGGTNASHVDGPVIKIGDDSFTFPTGDGGFGARIRVAPAGANTTTVLTAQYFTGIATPSGSSVSGITRVSQVEHWSLTRSGTLTNNTNLVTLYWESGTRSAINNVSSTTNLFVARFDGTNWVTAGPGTIAGGSTTTSGSVASANITAVNIPNNTLRYYTFGSNAALPINPLPIELLSFTATVNTSQVTLNWSTAQELDNDFFTVQKTIDFESFTEVGRVDGQGSSRQLNSYSLNDYAPFEGVSYYRLKQTDFDGTSSYSAPVRVEYTQPVTPELIVYPNPVTERAMTIEVRGYTGTSPVAYRLLDLQGRALAEGEIERQLDGHYRLLLEIESTLSPGFYVLKAGNIAPLVKPIFVK